MLCTAAFVWQSTLISINYFQFQTVSSINFEPPGKQKDRSLTICFPQYQMANYTNYNVCSNVSHCQLKLLDGYNISDSDQFLETFSVEERFEMCPTADDLFYHLKFNNKTSKRYLLGDYVCYQISREGEDVEHYWFGDISAKYSKLIARYAMKRYWLKNVTHFRLTASPRHVLPQFEFFTNNIIQWNNPTFIDILFSYYFYRFTKLKPPYIDQCTDYTTLGLRNRIDAVNDCINKFLMKKNESSRTKIFEFKSSMFDGTQYPMSSSDMDLISRRCYQEHPSDDCNYELTYTDVIKLDEYRTKERNLKMQQILTLRPSYVITNQEKIDDVDFVTYIFGAAGTWFGFCFLSIEPVLLIEWLYSRLNRNSRVNDGNEDVPETLATKNLVLEVTSKTKSMIKRDRIKNEKSIEELSRKVLLLQRILMKTK